MLKSYSCFLEHLESVETKAWSIGALRVVSNNLKNVAIYTDACLKKEGSQNYRENENLREALNKLMDGKDL